MLLGGEYILGVDAQPWDYWWFRFGKLRAVVPVPCYRIEHEYQPLEFIFRGWGQLLPGVLQSGDGVGEQRCEDGV